jgi:hypothetical protein
MPNTPNRSNEQPGSPEQRKRQQLNDKALQGADEGDAEDEDEELEAPGADEDEDEDGTPLRTEGGETGEDEDLPDDETTQVSRNPGSQRGRK